MNDAYHNAWAEMQQRQEEEQQYLEWAQQYDEESLNSLLRTISAEAQPEEYA